MTHIRAVLAILAGAAFGLGVGFLILNLGARQAGVWLAAAATLVVVWGLIRHIQLGRDKARHPSVWGPIQHAALDEPPVWPRYEIQPGQFHLPPWPTDDNEVPTYRRGR